MFRCRDAFLRETPRCLKVFRHTCRKDGSPSCIGNAVVLPSARFDLCSRPKPFRSRHPPPLSLLPNYPASLEKEQGFPTKKGALSRPRSLSLSAQLLRSVELAPRPRPSVVALRPRGRRGFPRSCRRSSKRLRRKAPVMRRRRTSAGFPSGESSAKTGTLPSTTIGDIVLSLSLFPGGGDFLFDVLFDQPVETLSQ